MMNGIETKARLRKEADILDRIDNVKRLVQMETTLLTVDNGSWNRYRNANNKGEAFGKNLLDDVRDEIQLQLLSIVALCYGDAPDVGEPFPKLEWQDEDTFREVWRDCLEWNA